MTRFVHFRDCDYTSAVTVAYELSGSREDKQREVIFGLAFCSRKDNFNKALGRKIAEGRLNSDRGSHSTTVHLEGDKNINIQVICALRKYILTEMKAPQDFRDIFSIFYPTFGELDTFVESKLEEMGLMHIPASGSFFPGMDFFNPPSEEWVEETKGAVPLEVLEVFDNA